MGVTNYLLTGMILQVDMKHQDQQLEVSSCEHTAADDFTAIAFSDANGLRPATRCGPI